MDRCLFLITVFLSVILASCCSYEQAHEVIEIDDIGYDIYGRDCAGGISIHITNASNSKDKIGENIFVKPTLGQFRLPEGLIASSKNKLTFYGHFGYEKCIHLMGDNTPVQALFFIYDSVDVSCPYKYWNSERMEFDPIECGNHESFHERIRVVKE